MGKKSLERKKKVRVTAVLVCMMLWACMLGGCGKKAPAETKPPKTTEQPEAPAGQPEETTDRSAETSEPEKEQSGQPEATTGQPEETAAQTEPAESLTEPAPDGQEAEGLPGTFPMEFLFSSGAGGWGTTLTLYEDGTFEGSYHDSEMGDQGDGYPNGSVYISVFTGKFGDIRKTDEYTWSMALEELNMQDNPGKEWIEDEIRYVAAEPFGVDGGETFLFYTPETPVAVLSETFLSWWPMRYFMEDAPDTLSCYGILNVETGDGFFTY